MEKRDPNIPKSLLLGLKVTQTIAPNLAYKKALKYFFTPVKFPITEEEFLYKSALPIHREKVNDKKITTYINGEAPFKVLLVHGWSGRISQFMTLGNTLKEKGISHISFTAPAHGSSSDKRSHMLEFAESIEYLNRIYGPFDSIIGHSLGATATMNAIKIHGVKPKKVVLIGAHATVQQTIKDFCTKLQLNETIENKLIRHLKKNYHEDYEQYSIQRIAGEFDVEALIVHDKLDKQAEYFNAEAIHNAFNNSKLLTTEGLGHVRILSDSEVVNQIVDFVKV
jgi:pimeloyl-ACP methyl ester carboxylesterase